MEKKLIIVGLMVGLIFSCISCSQIANQNPSAYSDALIVLSGAKNVHYQKLKGMDQIIYQLKEKYPASKAISEISTQLKSKDWQALKRDYLNPDIPSSHVRGWTDFIDGTKRPNERVHQWLAQWQDKQGNIVWYVFKYTYPINSKPNLSELKVFAGYVTASLAELQQEEVGKYIQ